MPKTRLTDYPVIVARYVDVNGRARYCAEVLDGGRVIGQTGYYPTRAEAAKAGRVRRRTILDQRTNADN